MNSNQINALINLIEDPDPGVYTEVSKEIVSYGESVIPQLEKHWEVSDHGALFQERIEQLIHFIQYDSVLKNVKDWCQEEDNSLLEGVSLINKYQYPSFDEEEVNNCISKIRQDIWLELNESLTALEIVRVFNHIIYTTHGFSGNKKNLASPQNSFLADVLSSKKGNPLSLAVIYRILAQSLDVPIYGVNLPNHFILAWVDENSVGSHKTNKEGEIDSNNILFYINPFTGGTIIHKNEIDEFLVHLDLPKKISYYHPCSNNDIVNRMVNNLIYSYAHLGKENKVQELGVLQKILKGNS